MSRPIKPIRPNRKVRRDGTCIIFLQYCYSTTKRTLLNTEITIPPKFWSSKKLTISIPLSMDISKR